MPSNPPFPWADDDPVVKEQIRLNLTQVLSEIRASGKRRDSVSLELARDWHERMLDYIPLAESGVAGGFRGSGPLHTELRRCSVIVGRTLLPGVPPEQVDSETRRFAHELSRRVTTLDQQIEPKAPPGPFEEEVLDLLAWTHGEWVRIHPFAQGNGRIARAWVVWNSVRYGLPLFITLRPRPRGPRGAGRMTPYERAATASMSGRHQLTRILFTNMLADHRR